MNNVSATYKHLPSYVLSIVVIAFCLLLNGCSTTRSRDGAPGYNVDETKIPNAVPKVEPLARHGNMPSYVVFGKRYYTMNSSKNYEAVGTASWYGTLFHARNTSSGEPYDMLGMTAAHKTLPLPTYVEVTNLKNNRTIIVKVNDRGPFESSRLIDLSYVAAKKLGMLGHGTAQVKIKAIDPTSWHSTDNMWLASNTNNSKQGVDFAGSPIPLKRTYTYYLEESHHLGGAPAKPAHKAYTYQAQNNPQTRSRDFFAQQNSKAYPHGITMRTSTNRAIFARNSHKPGRYADRLMSSTKTMSLVYLQVGAFRNKQHAQNLQKRLAALLATPVNVSRASSKGKLYNVRVGPIRDVSTANKLTHRLQNLGIKSNRLLS